MSTGLESEGAHSARWVAQRSLHRTVKRGARGVMGAASAGLHVAQTATATSTLAVGTAVVAGVAVSATGIGLAATAGALTVGTMALGARSAYSTNRHINRLVELSMLGGDDGLAYSCDLLPSGDALLHSVVKRQVLPYIIAQKRKKLHRKVATAAGAGAVVGVYTGLRSLFKSNKGVDRFFHAELLARHFITADCELATKVIAELFSVAVDTPLLDEFRRMDSDALGALLMDKMKST